MLIIDIFLVIVLMYKVLVRNERITPSIFWCTIWIVSLTFAILDPFDMMQVSSNAVLVIGVGTSMYLAGCAGNRNVRFTVREKHKILKQTA